MQDLKIQDRKTTDLISLEFDGLAMQDWKLAGRSGNFSRHLLHPRWSPLSKA